MRQFNVLCATTVALLFVSPAIAADGDIPKHLQGSWGEDGNCKASDKVLKIIGNNVTYAGEKSATKSVYDADGGPTGDGVINDADDGDIGGLGYVKKGDRLLWYPNGFDAGSVAEYKKCT